MGRTAKNQVHVRLTDEQYNAVKVFADLEGRSVPNAVVYLTQLGLTVAKPRLTERKVEK